jgi:uncharacterized protein
MFARGLLKSLWVVSVSAIATGVVLADVSDKAKEGLVTRSDFEIVECLLPGQVRQMGAMTYITQRRPTRTTTSDCRVRGGEYVAYDRADVKSALRIWLATAQAGDAEAQNNVGEIYERGVGGQPDYGAAAVWYQKAADQGNSKAQINLGFLYEQGLGVEKDTLKALNLYRQAAGLPPNSVVYADALEEKLKEKDTQIDALQKQVDELDQKVRTQTGETTAANAAAAAQAAQLSALRSVLAQLTSEKAKIKEQLPQSSSNTREPKPAQELPPLDPTVAIRMVNGEKIGRFYALIIGNQDYKLLEPLQTPKSDAAAAAEVLRDRYGFSVQVIDDANDVTMLKALNDLDRVLRPEDNLVIYYAGHGWRLKTGASEVGYWLPTNADKPPDDTYWVPNEQISAHIGRIAAKRILVVADSCYAGLLANDPSANLFGASGTVTAEYLKYKLPKRARLLLASGGDDPVLDVGGNGNSVFARAFIDVLRTNTGVLSTPALAAQLRDRVRRAAAQSSFHQVPDLKAIKSAGHELGDFFFVPLQGAQSKGG